MWTWRQWVDDVADFCRALEIEAEAFALLRALLPPPAW